MKKISVLTLTLGLFMSLFFVACSNIETVEEKDDDGNVVLKYSRDKETSAKEGLLKRFSADGKLLEASNYVNDTLHGERKIYTTEGQLEIVENYNMGDYSGTYTLYHPNGKVMHTGEYVANEMTGIWKGYYADGTLKEEVPFERNQEMGAFKEYHPNGKIAIEGTYNNGPFEMELLKEYDENGELATKKYCRKGVCKTIWTIEDGDIPFDEQQFNDLVERVKSLEQNE